MGVNNKQRRAAKQRARARGRTAPTPPRGDRPHGPGHASAAGASGVFGEIPPDARAFAELQLSATWRRLSRVRSIPVPAEDAQAAAAALASRMSGLPLHLVGEALTDLVARQLAAVLAGGWMLEEVTELIGARLDHGCAEMVRSLACRSRRRAADVPGLADGLRTLCLLQRLPLLSGEIRPASRPPAGTTAEQSRRLSTVRGLLAKAESTTFDEEAEALVAKAQELITKHALERLLEQADDEETHEAELARIWLEPPYVMAKAHLVAAVADANGCRSVVSESLGLCTVVGDRLDLQTVELLVTSLLLQADRAMLRHGRVVDSRGATRTRSFRQSFLISYASRIGERLQGAAESVVRETASGDARLLPVFTARRERVETAFSAMFPDLAERQTVVSNHLGWEAGRAAAELALLDVHGQVPGRRATG